MELGEGAMPSFYLLGILFQSYINILEPIYTEKGSLSQMQDYIFEASVLKYLW